MKSFIIAGLIILATCIQDMEGQQTKQSMKLGAYNFADWTGEKYDSKLSVSAEGLLISGGKNNPPIRGNRNK